MYNNEVVPSVALTRTELSINQNFISEFYLYFTIWLPSLHWLGLVISMLKLQQTGGALNKTDTECWGNIERLQQTICSSDILTLGVFYR